VQHQRSGRDQTGHSQQKQIVIELEGLHIRKMPKNVPRSKSGLAIMHDKSSINGHFFRFSEASRFSLMQYFSHCARTRRETEFTSLAQSGHLPHHMLLVIQLDKRPLSLKHS